MSERLGETTVMSTNGCGNSNCRRVHDCGMTRGGDSGVVTTPMIGSDYEKDGDEDEGEDF